MLRAAYFLALFLLTHKCENVVSIHQDIHTSEQNVRPLKTNKVYASRVGPNKLPRRTDRGNDNQAGPNKRPLKVNRANSNRAAPRKRPLRENGTNNMRDGHASRPFTINDKPKNNRTDRDMRPTTLPFPSPKSRHDQCMMVLREYCHAEVLCSAASTLPSLSSDTSGTAAPAGSLNLMSVSVRGFSALPAWPCASARAHASSLECSDQADAKHVFNMCIQTNASYLTLLALAGLRLPLHGLPTCAVVGSSGALLHARYGQEIDAHDIVMRFNTAHVDGFEPIAGSKKTITVVNTYASLFILDQCGISSSDAFNLGEKCAQRSPFTAAMRLAPNGCCANTRYAVSSAYLPVADCIRNVCLAHLMNSFVAHSQISKFFKSKARNKEAGSGAAGLALAEAITRNPHVDVYGFATVRSMDVTLTYHYYEGCRRHPFDGSFQAMAAVTSSLPKRFHRFVLREVAKGVYERYNGSLAAVKLCADGLPIPCGAFSCTNKKAFAAVAT